MNLAAERQRMRDRRADARSRGICSRCTVRPVISEAHLTCEDCLVAGGTRMPGTRPRPSEGLKREARVLIAAGHSQRAVARRLGVARGTIQRAANQ